MCHSLAATAYIFYFVAGMIGDDCLFCPDGFPGARGDAGNFGMPGLPGDRGERGIPGNVGPKGFRGRRGIRGSKGFAVCLFDMLCLIYQQFLISLIGILVRGQLILNAFGHCYYYYYVCV